MTDTSSRPEDRRKSVRRNINLNEKVFANFPWQGDELQIRLTSISKVGVVGLLEMTHPLDFPGLERGFFHLKVSSPRLQKNVLIEQLKLLRYEMLDESCIKLIFHSDLEETGVQLWQLGYELDQTVDFSIQHQKIADSEIPRIPGRGHYTEMSRLDRVEFIRNFTRNEFSRLDRIDLVAERLSSNIENLVGTVEIPVGLAGPLLFHGSRAQGMIFAPLATTEGALVASATRGATAITRSGGITTQVLHQQMIRVPFFRFHDLNSCMAFCRWLADHFVEVRHATQKVSRFSNLIKLDPMVSGSSVHVRFIYETGDAAGQNMTTTCTWHACLWILEQIKLYKGFKLEHFMIDGNVSGDKKVNSLSFLQGRGMRVTAECFIYEEELERVLKVSSKNLEKAYQLIALGATKIGMIGVNVNIANIIAAMFTATGQDIASVHESSLGILSMEAAEGGIYVSLLLPSLIIGTVGGGTGLPDQNQFLQMLGCAGSGHAARLAEIIAGYCLALDVSTLAALATGQFATAHERMGRNRPVHNLQAEELTPEFFNAIFSEHVLPPAFIVEKVEFLPKLAGGSSIITELTSRRLSKFMGLHPIRLRWKSPDSSALAGSSDAMVKIKALDAEVLMMMNTIASMCQPELAKAFRLHQQKVGFQNSHARELALYRQTDSRFLEHSPRCFGTLENTEREIFLLVLEDISKLACMNSVENPQTWRDDEIKATIQGLASLHSIWWKKEQKLLEIPSINPPINTALMLETQGLWEALGTHAAQEFPEWYTPDMLHLNNAMILSLKQWWGEIDKLPKTLIHNDFNPRNIALRKTSSGYRLCAYDWELASIQLPQHDLAEFFLFNASVLESSEQLYAWVDLHRTLLAAETGDDIPRNEWMKGFALSLQDLMIHRVGLYIMAHTLHHYKFIRRIVSNGYRLMAMTRDWLDL